MRLSYPNRIIGFFFLPLALLSLATPGSAQDEPAAPNPEAAEEPAAEESAPADESAAITTADPDIPLEHLELLLAPLTQEDLKSEVEAWRDQVKSALQKIAEKEIAARDATEDDGASREALLEELNELRNQKALLSERFTIAIDAYEAKGGDPSDYRKYALATAGLNVDLTDGSAVWSAVVNWLQSDTGGKKWFLKALQFLAIIAAFWFLATFAGRVVRRAVDRQPALTDLMKGFLNKMVRRTVLFIGLLVAISSLGVNVSALFALVGGGAFILGFALQDTLGNFAAGIMVLIYRPFDVGDAVEVGGVSGKVDNVSLVSTTIKTFDNKRVLVPNQSVWGEVITNATASSERRVDLVFGIGYEDDIEKAQGILERLVADHELVLADPEPVIKLHELADSSVNFICRPWAKTEDYWTVYWDLTRQVKEAFDAEGVSIPYPQLDVHTKSA